MKGIEVKRHTPATEFALLLFKPTAYLHRQELLEPVFEHFSALIVLEDFRLSSHAVDTIYIDCVGKPFYPAQKEFLMSGDVGVYLLKRKRRSQQTSPVLLHELLRIPPNSIHIPGTAASVARHARFFFSGLHLLNVGAGALVASLKEDT